MTTKRTSSNTAVAEAINTLNSRIERTENDFIGHLQKVEDRLDQIVDLTRTVALLQQQSNQQTDQISEIRNQIRENGTKVENSIGRIHTRLDEIQNHQRDKFELYSKDMDIKLETLKSQAGNTDKELKQWLNRGWGVWVVALMVFGVVQTSFYRWIDGLEKERVTISQLVATHNVAIERHNQQLENINSNMKDFSNSSRRLENYLDTNRK